MAKRVDEIQADIVDALREVGASVFLLHEVGRGCPDLLVGHRGQTYLLEVKSARGRLGPRQREWAERWRGHPVCVVRSVDEALEAVGVVENAT